MIPPVAILLVGDFDIKLFCAAAPSSPLQISLFLSLFLPSWKMNHR